VGTDIYNIGLSDRRAASVKAYLVKKGVDESRLTSTGYGASTPVADNKTAAGRQKNRRVELKPSY
jgi:OmpA-OmpF porin, OOP family